MIGRMEKLFLIGPKKLAPRVLLGLQRTGVVQIDPLRTDEIKEYQLSQDEEVLLRRWDGVAASADHALRLLELELDQSAKPYTGDLEEAEAAVSPLERQSSSLIEKQRRLREELDLIAQYRQIIQVLADAAKDLDQSPRLAVLPFLLERGADPAPLEQELASMLDGRFLLTGKPIGGTVAAMIIVLKRDLVTARGILRHHGLAELPRYGEYSRMSLKMMASRLAERYRLAPEETAAVEGELNELKREPATALRGLWTRAKEESIRLRTLKEMASGQYGFALLGWVPVSLKSRAEEAVLKFEKQMLHTFEAVDEHTEAERVPVMLENPGWARPFEPLVTFLNTPRYDAWDPTWVVALFLPLWFGMVVGDIGYALIFAALSWYFSGYVKRNQTLKVDLFRMRLSPKDLKEVVAVLRPMIGWTVIWGFLHGEFFGNLLQRLGIFGTGQYPGSIAVLIPRTDTVATSKRLILISIGFGACQVLYGLFLKAFLSHRRSENKHFWEATGYFCGVSALILFAYAFMTSDFRLWLVLPTIAGAALFFAGMIRARMPIMIAELPTQAGHILSYIRLYAVGLASAILADLATEVGYSLYHGFGILSAVIGGLAGLLIGLLIHAVLILLLTMGHVLQPLRLIWIEFFTKFDFYMARGRPYRPFKSVSYPP